MIMMEDKNIMAATCSDNYDIVIGGDGYISIENTTSQSVLNMLKLDLASNDDWVLDLELGLHWIDSEGGGMLQSKSNELQIAAAIHRKLMNFDGVVKVDNISIAKSLNREMFFRAEVLTSDNETIVVEKGVNFG